MKLLEAIVRANQAAGPGEAVTPLAGEVAEGLPLAALTCIDARLNRLLPERLGVPEEQFVWLRNAGNIISGPLSSTMRSMALACAVKGAREIAVIGHSDCQVCKSTMLKLIESMKVLGVDRHRLPENLVEYFGLFASERQNVMRAAEIIRSSPLIGSKVPVHGLLLDVVSGRLEWVVNGYETLGNTAMTLTAAVHRAEAAVMDAVSAMPELRLGELKMPEVKVGKVELPQIKVAGMSLPRVEIAGIKLPEIQIGPAMVDPNQWLSQVKRPEDVEAERPREVEAVKADAGPESLFDKVRRYKVVGSDQKVYGPISGLKILEWIADGRIGWDTPSQAEGSQDWRPLGLWGQVFRRLKGSLPQPPQLPGDRRRGKGN